MELGVVERVFPETEETYQQLKEELAAAFEQSMQLPVEVLLENRYQRFRRMGVPE